MDDIGLFLRLELHLQTLEAVRRIRHRAAGVRSRRKHEEHYCSCEQ
jgi:hypothetical protein